MFIELPTTNSPGSEHRDLMLINIEMIVSLKRYSSRTYEGITAMTMNTGVTLYVAKPYEEMARIIINRDIRRRGIMGPEELRQK